MALMNLPNPLRYGEIGKQVLTQSDKLDEAVKGKEYIIDFVGPKTGGITGELMCCSYLVHKDGTHYLSYIGNASWGGVTMVVGIKDEALVRGEVMIFEMKD